jgi:hypothetical protein
LRRFGQPERINPVKALRLLLCFGLAACADLEPKTWQRVDGNPTTADRLDLDKKTCRAEMQRSVQATNAMAALDYDVVRPDVYNSCMVRLGYSDTNNRRAYTPPAAQASAPTGVPGAAAPPAVQGAPTPPAEQECRKPSDFRLWLPLCP